MHQHSFDLSHIFWGNSSWPLIAEIAFRTVIMYIYALFLLRFVSRRGFGTLSLFEIIIIVAVGSAVGDPMLNPEVPLVRGFVVITVVIIAMRATVMLVMHSSKAEDIIEGKACRVVRDGLLDWKEIRKVAFSREEVAMKLRLGGIQHLGQVKGAYVESNGDLSIFSFPPDQVTPGLPLTPPWDVKLPKFFEAGKDSTDKTSFPAFIAATLSACRRVHHCRNAGFVKIQNGCTRGTLQMNQQSLIRKRVKDFIRPRNNNDCGANISD